MPWAITTVGAEIARAFAFNEIYTTIEVLDGGGAVLGSVSIPDELADTGMPDGTISNSAKITMTPTASGTAATVRAKASTGQVTAQSDASDVLDNLNVVQGTPIDIPVGALQLAAS